jgi:hypothetical protein
VGTVLGLVVGPIFAVLVGWWALLVFGAVGYGVALASHRLVQCNRPFAHRPLWGLVSDLRMLVLALSGGLPVHLQRLQQAGQPSKARAPAKTGL